MKTFEKVAAAFLDYQWDWSDWLNGDTIQEASFVAPDDMTVDPEQVTIVNGKVTAWISGGTEGIPGVIICKIVTAEGRHDERSARFEIKPK